MIRITWCIFEIFLHKFEKVIEISEDFMLFPEISDFFYIKSLESKGCGSIPDIFGMLCCSFVLYS